MWKGVGGAGVSWFGGSAVEQALELFGGLRVRIRANVVRVGGAERRPADLCAAPTQRVDRPLSTSRCSAPTP
jgi:hypothetical protein